MPEKYKWIDGGIVCSLYEGEKMADIRAQLVNAGNDRWNAFDLSKPVTEMLIGNFANLEVAKKAVEDSVNA